MNLPDQSDDEHSGAGDVSLAAARGQPAKRLLHAAALCEGSG
jgi:hypothetical protein